MTAGRSPDLPRIPELEEDYELVRELGRGGTAVVYLARDRELGRDVAIKLIRPSHLRDEDAVARLVREARTVGQLQHPNIVMLLGTRRLGHSGLALILQFVPGRTLKQQIREEGPLPFPRAESILRDLGRALSYAHRRRIVHRDIKPENVYLDDDAEIARLADFGIARAWDSDSGLTLPGTAIGTPTYMSPEQVDGGDLDGRSDIYALGLLAWEMLTGRQPWAGESLYSVIYKQKHEDLPDLAELRPDTPANLRRAIAGALPKDRDARWATADDFLGALARGSLLPPEAPSIGGIPHSRGRESHAPVSPDAHTIRFHRPGAADPGHDPPDEKRPRDPPPVVPGPAEGSWEGEAVAAGRGADDPGARPPQPYPAGPDPLDGGSLPAPGRMGRAAKRRKKRKRIVRAATLLLLALLVGGGGAAVAFTSPDGEVRSLLGQILPLNGDRASLDEEPYGSWQPADPDAVETGNAEPAEAGGTAGDDGVEGTEEAEPVPEIAEPPPDARLEITAGGGQEAPSGRALPGPVVVRVADGDGEPVAGVPVILGVAAGGGSVSPSRAVTGQDGTVSVVWTMGAADADQSLSVSIEGQPEPREVIEARSTPRLPASLRVESASSVEGEVGQALADPLEVRVLDQDGSAIPGVPVRFEVVRGGGSLSASAQETDSDGIARVRWTLGEAAGEQEVLAAVAEDEGLQASFSAEATPPRLPGRSAVLAGGTHTCRLEGGALACWGDNARGQLGDGGTARRGTPGPSVSGPFSRATAGLSHSCAIDGLGRAYCWGANESGQLGDGSTTGRTDPVPVADAPLFVEIEAGVSHTCARTGEGAIYCWGANGDGQLGDGTTTSRATPARIDSDLAFRAVAVGWRHTCALDSGGTVHCWGTNTSGELGRSTLDRFPSPARVAGGHTFVQLSAGNAHTCGLTGGGAIACWGANDHGQLGDGTTETRRVPTPVSSGESFTGISAGAVHTCALASSGSAFCWGRNIYGQVGDGTTTDRSAPVEVAGSYRFDRLHAFGSHTCARTPGGDAFCWGYNAEGQLGDGTRQNRSSPVEVGGG